MASIARIATLTLLACASLTAHAFARQTSSGPSGQLQDPRKDSKIRIGPFFLTPGISLDRLGYDRNVVDSDGNLGSDFVVSFQPRLKIGLAMGTRAVVITTLSNGFTFFKNHSSQNSLDPGITVRADAKVWRLLPFASASYEQVWRNASPELEFRVPLVTRGKQVGVVFAPTTFTWFELSAHRDDFGHGSNSRYLGINLSQTLDRHQQGVRLSAFRKLTSLTTARFVIENQQERFTSSTSRDSSGIRTVVGAEFGRRAFLSGDLEVGYRHIRSVTATVPTFDGLVAKLDLAHRFRNSVLSAGWARDAVTSFLPEYPYFVTTSTREAFRQDLGRSFDGILTLDQQRASYTTVIIGATRPHTSTKGIDVDLGYGITRSARVGLKLGWTWRNSTVPGFRDYSGLRLGLSFSSAGF